MNLQERLQKERIETRKTWGIYVDLIAQIRKTEAVKREQRLSELVQMVMERRSPP